MTKGRMKHKGEPKLKRTLRRRAEWNRYFRERFLSSELNRIWKERGLNHAESQDD